jgi:hypothetical protein
MTRVWAVGWLSEFALRVVMVQTLWKTLQINPLKSAETRPALALTNGSPSPIVIAVLRSQG